MGDSGEHSAPKVRRLHKVLPPTGAARIQDVPLKSLEALNGVGSGWKRMVQMILKTGWTSRRWALHDVTLLVVTLALGACSNTVASLHYVAPAPLWTVAAPSIGGVIAQDQRREAPTRLATIMGGYGNPLKTLDTAKPVKDEVADAFLEGLRAREMLAPASQAPLRIELRVRKFDADMIIGRTARIDLTMSLFDQPGAVVYQNSAVDSEPDMKFLETGIFANIADLQALSQTVLNRTVNRMLDDPQFRAALDRYSVR